MSNSIKEKLLTFLKKIPEYDGTWEYYESGNMSDCYEYGLNVGRSMLARELEEMIKSEEIK